MTSEIKILIVCSKNSGRIAPFITEQADALRNAGTKIDYYYIEGKGWKGYLKNRRKLLNKIAEYHPDIIHAHYGLSGLLANTQRKIPVVTTYHGSDINLPHVFRISKLNMMFSAHNIFVSDKNVNKAGLKRKYSLIPCGVNLTSFNTMDRMNAREKTGLDLNRRYILFSGAFQNAVKNPELAIAAVKLLPDVTLLEMKGYSRNEVAQLMYAVDACLMTSYTEGSPQFIKEAMSCGCPLVSVDVGDVADVIGNTDGCYLTSYEIDDVVAKLTLALNFQKRTKGRERILELQLDNSFVANQLIAVYNSILRK